MLLARVVACNFDQTIFDTNDLSTIRGSSLILLRFPESLIQGLQKAHSDLSVAKITSGASELLFRFAARPGASEAVERYLCAVLRTGERNIDLPLRLFTFVWAVENGDPSSDGKDFHLRQQSLVARCNYEQFRHPTIVIPAFYPDSFRSGEHKSGVDAKNVVCSIDGIRPSSPSRKQGQKQFVSDSVSQRKHYGTLARQLFYDWALKDGDAEKQGAPVDRFADMFKDMLPDPAESLELSIPESLTGKMALVYLDGNSFGKRRDAEAVRGENKLQAFSEKITGLRRDLLRHVLDDLKDRDGMMSPEIQATDTQEARPARLRFETLLWGGDEVMWVLPAWQAWAFMEVVQRHLADSTRWGELKHAAGLLIAPYKTPIRDLTALVRDLGDAAKRGDGREMNGVQVGVITGFDLPGLTVDGWRRPLLSATPAEDEHNTLCATFQMDGGHWGEIRERMSAIKDPDTGLPRSSLYRLYHAALRERMSAIKDPDTGLPRSSLYHKALRDGLFGTSNSMAAKEHLETGIARIQQLNEKINDDALKTLREGFPGASGIDAHPLSPLYQILQLWDIAR